MEHSKKAYKNLFVIGVLMAILGIVIIQQTAFGQEDNEEGTDDSNLIIELKELSEIQEEDRTVDNWKRIIQIILKISMKYADNIDIIYSQWANELQKYKELNKRNEELNKQLENTIQNYKEAEATLYNTEKLLQTIIQDYQSRLKEIERNNFSNYVGISPILNTKGKLNINITYLHFFTYNISIGTVVSLSSVNDSSNFSLGLGICLGYLF